MDIPAQLIIFSIPALLYVPIQRRRGIPRNKAHDNLGWRGCPPIFFLWGLAITVVSGVGVLLALQTIPPDILRHANLSTAAYATWPRTVPHIALAWLREAVYVALGEEIFFRGLLGGWLTRRYRFVVGNTLQAALFLLPHLLLLLVSPAFWPVTLAQFIIGWLLGWLRYRSGSILPGWLAHSLANTLGAATAMG